MSDVETKTADKDSNGSLRFGRNLNWLVAELVVVVMGVVLGFAFSAWWQDFQDDKDSRLSLARLSENLTTTLHDLQGDIEAMEQSAEAVRMLINTKPSDRTPESAALALARIFDTRMPIAEIAEYQALTSTGKLRDIANPKIVTGVTSIYEQLPYLMSLSNLSEKRASDLRMMVSISMVYQDIPSFALDAPIFKLNEHAEELLTRADVRAQIVEAGYCAAFQAMRYRSVISGITDVLEEIDNELR